jgi:hypothetical protein
VWWADLLWGFWNGLTAWIVLVVHIFGGWEQFPFYNEARSGNWYDFGFLLGAGSPFWAPWAGEAGEVSRLAAAGCDSPGDSVPPAWTNHVARGERTA